MFDFINSHLRLIIFIYYNDDYYYYYYYYLWWLLLLLLLILNMSKILQILNLSSWYYKEEILILDFKCWNTFRCNGSWDTIKERNKASKQLICSCDKNIVKRDFINILNLFHTYVWLDEAIKLLMKNHEIRLICSIPRSECSNK